MHTFAWWDHPEPFNARAEDAITLSTELTTARPCLLSELDIVALVGGAGGAVSVTLRFRDQSDSPCEVRGVPQVRLLDAAGTVWHSTKQTAAPEGGTAVVLVPGSWAESSLWVGSTCGGAGATTVVSVSLPGQAASRRIQQRLGGPWSRDCGPPPGPPKPQPGHLKGAAFAPIDPPSVGGGIFLGVTLLDGALSVPGQVRRGSVLHYQLVLTAKARDGGAMDGGDPADGSTCPLYEARLAGAGGSYELRCDVPVILRQGQSVAYDLQLKVPADAPLGPTALRWQFLEPRLPALTAAATIVR